MFVPGFVIFLHFHLVLGGIPIFIELLDIFLIPLVISFVILYTGIPSATVLREDRAVPER